MALENLVSENQTKLKNQRTKSVILLVLIIVIVSIITILMTIFFAEMIDFKKLISFVILTFVLTAVCEIIFYFEIFSKIKTTNDDSLLIELYNQLTKLD
jgi:SNF family Na+-dependent transporter